MDEAGGSKPPSSTASTAAVVTRHTLAGFVAGEGCFTVARQARRWPAGEVRKRFVFVVAVASRDRAILEQLHAVLGVGSIHELRRNTPRWEPQSRFFVNSLLAHQQVTIPYFDAFLLGGAKREQFVQWRDQLLAYVDRHQIRWGRGRSTCKIPGCCGLVRGRGLCRSHYYRVTGW